MGTCAHPCLDALAGVAHLDATGKVAVSGTAHSKEERCRKVLAIGSRVQEVAQEFCDIEVMISGTAYSKEGYYCKALEIGSRFEVVLQELSAIGGVTVSGAAYSKEERCRKAPEIDSCSKEVSQVPWAICKVTVGGVACAVAARVSSWLGCWSGVPSVWQPAAVPPPGDFASV